MHPLEFFDSKNFDVPWILLFGISGNHLVFNETN